VKLYPLLPVFPGELHRFFVAPAHGLVFDLFFMKEADNDQILDRNEVLFPEFYEGLYISFCGIEDDEADIIRLPGCIIKKTLVWLAPE
jgi:hypothetical protein